VKQQQPIRTSPNVETFQSHNNISFTFSWRFAAAQIDCKPRKLSGGQLIISSQIKFHWLSAKHSFDTTILS